MLNNQDFALLRAKSLGGSDVGAILGLSKYRSAVDVWMEIYCPRLSTTYWRALAMFVVCVRCFLFVCVWCFMLR